MTALRGLLSDRLCPGFEEDHCADAGDDDQIVPYADSGP